MIGGGEFTGGRRRIERWRTKVDQTASLRCSRGVRLTRTISRVSLTSTLLSVGTRLFAALIFSLRKLRSFWNISVSLILRLMNFAMCVVARFCFYNVTIRIRIGIFLMLFRFCLVPFFEFEFSILSEFQFVKTALSESVSFCVLCCLDIVSESL